jgi:prophage tail gpP-like protein
MGDARPHRHKVTVSCNGQQIGPFKSYSIKSDMIEPCDSFQMSTRFDTKTWDVLRLDSRVQVQIDGVTVLTGFIDRKRKNTKDASIEISGRDIAGRLVQESAPSINYSGLTMVEALRRLASPWVSTITLSDARNRAVRRGKGRRVPAGNEPIVLNMPVPKRGKVHPGMTRWQVIEDIVSQAGYFAFVSADGRELIVGSPNHEQAPQYLFVHGPRQSTVIEMDLVEDIGDSFSLIAVVGTGPGDQANYGRNVERSHRWRDDDSTPDGIGRNFLHPKRLMMPERDFDSNDDAERIAEREAARRNFRMKTSTATCAYHGQYLSGGTPTIFAPHTIARVIDEDFEPAFDDKYMITSCAYAAAEGGGETTQIEMVPQGTEIIL